MKGFKGAGLFLDLASKRNRMTKILSLLFLLILVAGCADSHRADPHYVDPRHAAVNASARGDHAEAAKNFLLSAEQREKDWLFEIPISYTYCLAASEFLKAGGADNVRNSIGSAIKGVAKSRDLAEKYRASQFGQKFLRATKNMFVCKLILAQGRLFNGDHEGVRELVKEYTGLEAEPAWFVFDDKVDDPDYDNLGINLVRFLQSQNPELAGAVEKHFRSSSLAVAEQQKRDEVIRKAREAEQARIESIKREQAAREATMKREREAQEVAAQAEYERQHPEIARAKQVQAAAEKQCAACKSSCDSQSLGCIAACFGNLEDTMCSGRCQVALNTCKNGCEEQRDALIVQTGGTPLGTSSSGTATLLQGLVTMGDSLAAAKGLPSSGTSGFATSATPSMQTSMASFAQALSALAGSTVVAPGSKRSSSQSAKVGGAPSASVGNICDDSAEVREVQAMEKTLPIEVKGMRGKRLGCYIAGQSVKIAQLQMRAATRCNTDLVEAREYLLEVQADERKACQGVSMK